MKRSRRISLTLLASLTLAACGSDQATQQAAYRSRQDCVTDWGSEEDCENDGRGGWYGPHYFFMSGRPYFYSKRGASPIPVPDGAAFSKLSPTSISPRATRTIATNVSRGGFGRSAFFHGASS